MLLLALAVNGPEVGDEVAKRLTITILVAVLSSTATFFFGRWYGRYQAGRQWHKKEFLDRVTVSLNTFTDGKLQIRTVMERSLDEVFLNRLAVATVWTAAKGCTVERPILPIPPADRWFLLNFVLNAVAEYFVAGQFRRDAGQPVTVVRYALFLTCEVLGEERIRKVRAMLLRQDLLENFPYPEAMPAVENSWHTDRIKTLRKAAELYRTEPDNFLLLEVCV